MIFFDKIWLEATHGSNPSLLLSLDISKVQKQKPFIDKKPFFINLNSELGLIGYLEVKRLAVIDNQVIFEVISLQSKSYQIPDDCEVYEAGSSHLLRIIGG